MNIVPSVSVIVCLYNTDPQIFSKTLNSIVNQTLTDFEVIIVNDGSTKYLEENKKLIEDLKDNRFLFFDRPHEGKSQTLNFALTKVRGDYIAINDSDDQMYPNRLSYQHEFLSLGECEVIFNAMESNPKHITLPGIFPSQRIESWNLNYLGNHPCMMMKTNSLSKVKMHFSQIYDSIEDNVFNYIMFHSGLIMFYDETVLETYSIGNPDALHLKSFVPYYKEACYKLFFRTFGYKQNNPDFTAIILYNKLTWGNELEKTLLNIRLTSNNVKILIIDYSKENELMISPQKYNVIIENSVNTYVNAVNLAFETCDTPYFMLISKPIRFYNQNWDLYMQRKFENVYQYDVVQPNLFDIKKRDDYNYDNENGNIEINNRYGLELQLLSKNLTHTKDKLDLYFDYSTISEIPVLNEDMIFAGKTKLFKNLHINEILPTSSSINVFISLFKWLNDNHICIDTDFKCGIIDIQFENLTEYNYYDNLYRFSTFFLNETKFLYDKILLENISKKDYQKIIDTLNKDSLYHTHCTQFKHTSDMSYFLKNINLQYNLWIQ